MGVSEKESFSGVECGKSEEGTGNIESPSKKKNKWDRHQTLQG